MYLPSEYKLSFLGHGVSAQPIQKKRKNFLLIENLGQEKKSVLD